MLDRFTRSSFVGKISSRKVHKIVVIMVSILLIVTALCAIGSTFAQQGPKVTDIVSIFIEFKHLVPRRQIFHSILRKVHLTHLFNLHKKKTGS